LVARTLVGIRDIHALVRPSFVSQINLSVC
jgi:hypothetical protein